jgi:phosphotransferase system HPr (HPr) family protein
MSGPTLRQNVTITHSEGLHMRPVRNFVECAMRYQSDVFVSKGDNRANGRNALELFMLFAPQGTELTVEVCGPDAEAALPALIQALNAPLEGSDEADNVSPAS